MKTHNYETQFLYHVNHCYIDEPLDFGEISLVQLGRMFFTPKARVDTHTHLEWFELTVATHGEGEVEVNGVKIPVCAGDIVLSLPCDTHAIYSSETEPLRFDFFSFYCTNEEIRRSLDGIGAAVYAPEARVCRGDRIPYLISCAIDEMNKARPDMKQMLSAIFKQILLYILRAYGTASEESGRESDASKLCYKIMQYLDTHIYTLKNLYELTDITNYNYSYLSAVFKNTTGISISEYFRNKKLLVAKKLLTEEELSPSEVAGLLQYSGVFAFSKAYKKHYGISPRRKKAPAENTP